MTTQHVLKRLESPVVTEAVPHHSSHMSTYQPLYDAALNLTLHFLLSYVAADSILGDARDYISHMLAFSVLFGLDHVLYVLGTRRHLLPESRSAFHRFYRLILFLVGVSICSLSFDIALVKITALSAVLRYAIDFFLCETSPFCLFSDREVLLQDLTGFNAGHGTRDGTAREPSKSRYVRKAREITDRMLLSMPLPRIDPNILSALSVLTSLLFALALRHSPTSALILLIVTLLLDWFDGVIAKKHGLCSEKGCMVDIISDRLSEGIMFIPFYTPWFHLFVLNNLLVILSLLRNKRRILPLRQVFLVYFLLSMQR